MTVLAWLFAATGFPLRAQAVNKQHQSEALAPSLSEGDLGTFIDGIIAEQFQDRHLAGAVVTIVKDGHLLFSRSYGYADINRQLVLDPARTAIRPGSISKLFTWTAVMQLVEQGKIDLDEDVNKYLTTFQIPPGPGGPITMRHLMTHTPGFDDTAPGTLAKLSPTEFLPLGTALAEHVPARVRPPGQISVYSNYGAALAGYIVQQLSGEAFEKYIYTHIFKKLDMVSSTFTEPVPAPLNGNLATGYYYSRGQMKAGPFEYIHNFAPTGGMTTTAEDMARFMIAYLQGGQFKNERILEKSTADAMLRRSFSQDPVLPGMALGFYEMQAGKRTLLTHKGRTTFFMSQLALLPEENFGVFVAYNAAEGAGADESLIRALIGRYFAGSSASVDRKANSSNSATEIAQIEAQRITGVYRTTWHSQRTFGRVFMLGRDVHVTATDDGNLLVEEGDELLLFQHVLGNFYRESRTQEPLVVRRDAGNIRIFRVSPVMALEKLSMFERSDTHYWLLGIGFLGALASVIATIRRLAFRRTPIASYAGGLAMSAAAAVLLTFAIGMMFLFASPAASVIAWRVPTALRYLVWLPPLGVLMAVGAVLLGLLVNRKSLADRWFLIGAAAVAILAWSLNYWNLMGPHFG